MSEIIIEDATGIVQLAGTATYPEGLDATGLSTPDVTTGASEDVSITTGDAAAGETGRIDVATGTATGDKSGLVQIVTGDATGEDSGAIIIRPGAATGGNGGVVQITGGGGDGATGTGGGVNLQPGAGDTGGTLEINDSIGDTHVEITDGKVRLGTTGGDVGFYGTAPIPLQTGVPVSAAGIHAALVALGLITA